MKKILVLHGPNLNRLGQRETHLYGFTTLQELNATLYQQAERAGVLLSSLQSNSEADLINAIHQAADEQLDYILINPAALGHTSIALRDALLGTKLPFYEVHISNIFSREPFRQHSYLSDIAEGFVCGFGVEGYSLALDAILKKLFSKEPKTDGY